MVLNRADDFLARTRAHLATCEGDDRAQLQFLTALISGWERAYARFVCVHGGDLDPPKKDLPITASDYLLTIVGLAALREQVRRRMLAAPRG